MTHSLELLLDPDSEAAVRAQWQALADAGLPSQLRVKSPTNRPHVTVLAAAEIAEAVDDVLRALASRFPFDCVIGATVVFGGPRLTLARLIVPSAALLSLHDEIYRLSLPHVSGDPYAHCAPGHWTAHATLGRRFTAAEVGAALDVVDSRSGEIAAQVTGLRRWDGDRRVDHLLVG